VFQVVQQSCWEKFGAGEGTIFLCPLLSNPVSLMWQVYRISEPVTHGQEDMQAVQRAQSLHLVETECIVDSGLPCTAHRSYVGSYYKG